MHLKNEAFTIMLATTFTKIFRTSASVYCQNTMDCHSMNLDGYECQNMRCVCNPKADTGIFSCQARAFNRKCRNGQDCYMEDPNLVCPLTEPRTCRCRLGFEWDYTIRKCYRMDDGSYGTSIDHVRDLIIPGVIVMTLGAIFYLSIKFFCNCGKMWRSHRRPPELPRDLEHSQQAGTWVASYRVFSSLNSIDGRSGSNGAFQFHQGGPCMGLFVPSSSLVQPPMTSPPSYEESLKHKVVLSSFPTNQPLQTSNQVIPQTHIHNRPS